jgi:cyclic dehypoxanthinyl futalosine synthase
MLAVSRLFLDNVEHIQSSWLTQGLRLGQVALRFGADDMGSMMIEENVVSAAGAHNTADEKMLRYLIREAGFRRSSATYSTATSTAKSPRAPTPRTPRPCAN